ncbi:MAG: hypothetical protein WCK56_01455 [Alcaligenaceae bacterium]
MKINNTARLTDSLERELLAKAMEDQFRPHPFRAVGRVVRGLVAFTNSARAHAKHNSLY